MKNKTLIVVVSVIALAFGIFARTLIERSWAKSDHHVLPDVSLPDLSGKPHSFKEWKGKILVVNFWATWCPPCLKEMPQFKAMQSEFGDKGLQFVGVAIDEIEPVKAFIEKQQINFPILVSQDEGAKIAHDLGNIMNTVPFTLIADRNGNIVKTRMGEIDREDLLEIVTPLLETKSQ